ncbi:MAG: alanine racemase [Clostridiaceae bacterium]|jgi:alanine racemase|nr:alanine racemase [Clostridiaceae bacterium]
MKNSNRTWCEVSIDAIESNINLFKSICNSKIMAMVKADAYGAGAIEVSKAIADKGVAMFGVALAEEALQLRSNNIKAPILTLGYVPESLIKPLVEHDVTISVFDTRTATIISKIASELNKTAKIHIKIDTGMHRLGFSCDNASTVKEIHSITCFDNIQIEGLFTHFACADKQNDGYTKMQFNKFMYIANLLENEGITIPIKHTCNSAAALRFPEMHLDMIRLGISLYGFFPSEIEYNLALNPAIQLKTKITHINKLQPGEKISYGGTFQTTRESILATIPVGYADGYSRGLSNKAQVLVNGKFAPIIGTICMDQCIIDVTDVNNINVEDEVVLFGTQNGLSISVEELAKINGVINYEVISRIGKRVPRHYYQNGNITSIHDLLFNPA